MDLYEDIFSSGLRGSPSSNKPPTDYEASLEDLNDDIHDYRAITDPDTTEMTPREIVEETDKLIRKLQKFYNATPSHLRDKYKLYTSLDGSTERLQTYEEFHRSLQTRKRRNLKKIGREETVTFGDDDDDEDFEQSLEDLLTKYDKPEEPEELEETPSKYGDPEDLSRESLPSQSQPLGPPEDLHPNLPQAEQEEHSYFQQFFKSMGPENHQYTGPYTKIFKKIRDGIDPHSPLDALSLAHDTAFSLVLNPEQEKAADDTYLKHVDRLLRNISSRNFGGKYDKMIQNINMVRNAFFWKKSIGKTFLTQEQYHENNDRPQHVKKELFTILDRIHDYSNKGRLRDMPMKGFTKGVRDRDPVSETDPEHPETEELEPVSERMTTASEDIDVTSGLSEGLDPAARAGERRGEGPGGPPGGPHGGPPGGPRRGPHRRPPFPRGHPRYRGPPMGANPAMEEVFRQREREKRIFLNNEALADDPESVHWLRPSFLKRYKELEKLQYYASQEHKAIEDYNDELLFDRHSGFGERTERSSKGLNMVNKMAERDYCLRFNLDPNKPFFNNKKFIGTKDKDVTFGKGVKYNYDYINKKYPLYTLPRDYSPAYQLDNNSRINEGVSYDEYINAGLGHIYGFEKYDNYCNKMKYYPDAQQVNKNYMDAPLKNQIDQTPQFPFNRHMFDKVEPIRKQGGDIPASIQCDEEINRVGENIKDKTPQYNQWTDAYSNHYNRMYTKPRYNTLYFK